MAFLNPLVEELKPVMIRFFDNISQPIFTANNKIKNTEMLVIGKSKNQKKYVACWGNKLINQLFEVKPQDLNLEKQSRNFVLEKIPINKEQLYEASDNIFRVLKKSAIRDKLFEYLQGNDVLIENFEMLFEGIN